MKQNVRAMSQDKARKNGREANLELNQNAESYWSFMKEWPNYASKEFAWCGTVFLTGRVPIDRIGRREGILEVDLELFGDVSRSWGREGVIPVDPPNEGTGAGTVIMNSPKTDYLLADTLLRIQPLPDKLPPAETVML